jgi:N-acetyl-1-D-myo-inositol-2-amino-2-deoxy-alpha-D-glucopyranoside deacetylase
MKTLARIIGARKARHSVPDEHVDVSLDVTPWLDQKINAVLSHRSEVRRGALPGLVASLPPDARAALLGTEWYTCRDPASAGRAVL